MKKTLLLGLISLGGLFANAQETGLVDGTLAPNIVVNDIDGNPHNLNDLLDEGKSVILYFSATWCGPCWSYHNTHYMSDLYKIYGPEASDEVEILYIESDATTSVQDILGPSDASWGDWTAGTPYPIIDSADTADDYLVTSYPTMYLICPDTRTTLQIPRNTPAGLRDEIADTCGTLTGITGVVEAKAASRRLCGDTAVTNAYIYNMGTDNLTSATVVLKADGNVVATKDFTPEAGETIEQYDIAEVAFDEYTFDSEVDYTFEITAHNGIAGNGDTTLIAAQPITYNAADDNLSGINIKLEVHTDNYPGETSWNLYNSAGELVQSGGPYEEGPGQDGAGGPDALTTKVHEFLLDEEIDCYSFEILDSFGDGLLYGPQGSWFGVKIYSGNTEVYNEAMIGTYGSRGFSETIFKTTGQLGTEQFDNSKFAVYPNPTTGILNFTTEEVVNVTVMDLTGKVVYTAKGINNGDSINLSSLQSGMYIAKINGLHSEKTEKIVIK